MICSEEKRTYTHYKDYTRTIRIIRTMHNMPGRVPGYDFLSGVASYSIRQSESAESQKDNQQTKNYCSSNVSAHMLGVWVGGRGPGA